MILINSENKYNEVQLAYGKNGYKLKVPTNFDVIEPKFIKLFFGAKLLLKLFVKDQPNQPIEDNFF